MRAINETSHMHLTGILVQVHEAVAMTAEPLLSKPAAAHGRAVHGQQAAAARRPPVSAPVPIM